MYEYIATQNKNFKGVQPKLSRAKNVSETIILGGSGSHSGRTMLLDGSGVEKPMLGRYQVEKELGKGAIGVVYLGKDPKIGRVVAIKTMALSKEFEGEALYATIEFVFARQKQPGICSTNILLQLLPQVRSTTWPLVPWNSLTVRTSLMCRKQGTCCQSAKCY